MTPITHRIGIVTPPANPTVEPEARALLPESMALHATRLPVLPGDLRERNAAYAGHYEAAIRSFGALRLDAHYIGSTGATYTLGPAGDRALCAQLATTAGAPVWTASRAILEALAVLGRNSLCLVSPYPSWLTDLAVAYWEDAGLHVAQVVTTGDTFRAYELQTHEVMAALQQVRPAPGSAVLLSGTGMITLPAIQALQSGIDSPLLSSNLCGCWQMLRSLRQPATASLTQANPALAAALASDTP